MFYHYIYAHNTNYDFQNGYHFFAMYDKHDKMKIANRMIKNDNKFKINESYFEEDSLFLTFSFAYDINFNYFYANYDLGEDNRAFTAYYNFIAGKRKSKITDARLKEIKHNTFENAYEGGYNNNFFGHTFFFKDKNNQVKYGHKCSLVFLFNSNINNDIFNYFSLGSLNKQPKDDNYFCFPNTKVYDKYDSYGKPANRNIYIPARNDIEKTLLPNKHLKDIDTCDFLTLNGHTIYYNVLINFKRYINNYNFEKDLLSDPYCHSIDMNDSEIYNDYLNIYNNHQVRIKELFKDYLNKMIFLNE